MRSSSWQQQQHQKRRKDGTSTYVLWIIWSYLVAVAVASIANVAVVVESFVLHRGTSTRKRRIITTTNNSSRQQGQTCLFGAKRKLSFAQRKKQRGRKQASASSASFKFPVIGYPGEEQTTKEEERATTTTSSSNNEPKADDEDARVKAAKLIEAQRDSIQTLTHVRQCIELRKHWNVVAQQLSQQGYAVVDNFLIPPMNDDGDQSSTETISSFTKKSSAFDIGAMLIKEMFQEGVSLKINGLSELTSIGSGLYQTLLKGGDSYSQSPRCIEYCVSLTKHLPAAMLGVGETEKLDNTASMSMMQTFDKKSKLASLELLMGKDAVEKYIKEQQQDDETPFQTVVSYDDTQKDHRKLTCVYYLLEDKDLNGIYGTGIQFSDGKRVDIKRDRLVLFWSDTTKYKPEQWSLSTESPNYTCCIVTHFISNTQTLQ